MTDIAIGAEGEASWIVQESDLASCLSDGHSGSFPDVFSTSRMVALMELGELSVGTLVDFVHTAATPPGARVRAVARYTGRHEKAYAFEIVAYDPAGEIGRGRHHRTIIDTERLLRGAAKRARTS